MLRARIPLAVALLAATLVIPATAASAAGDTPSDPTGVTKQVTGTTPQDQSADSQSSSGSTSSADKTGTDPSGTDPSGTDPSGTDPTSGGGSGSGLNTSGGSSGLGQLTSGFQQLQDAADEFQQKLQNSGSSGSSPDIAGALQTFGTCLQSAGSNAKPFLAGQQCIENLLAAITNDPRAHCFSENNFTLQFLIDRLQSGEPPSQADAEQFQNNLAGLLACLNPSTPPDDTSGGGGATQEAAPQPTATSDEAPAATPVSGSPNFTG